MLFLILMAVMSTGSAEVIAVSSIIIYDVYQAYVQPFRPDLKDNECIICGKPIKAKLGVQVCICPSTSKCEQCKVRAEKTFIESKVSMQLSAVGQCRPGQGERSCEATLFVPNSQGVQRVSGVPAQIQEQVHHLMHVSLNPALSLLLGRQPQPHLDLLLHRDPHCIERRPNCNLHFVGQGYSGRYVCSICFFLPCNSSSKSSISGMIAGVIGGCICGMISWLSYASQFPGGLTSATFVKNTGEEFPMLVGNCVAITFGAIFSILVSFCTRPRMTADEVEAEWEITRNIDNPLSPWVEVYKVFNEIIN